MNEDELARLLRATPGEPELPADPVAVVRRRAGQVRRRKQLVAGGLAAVLVAAAGGAVVGAPGGHSSGGTAVLREATDPPTVSPTDTTPSASPTPSDSSTSAAPAGPTTADAVATTADPNAVHFNWDVHVDGTTVTVGGAWVGRGPTVSVADIERVDGNDGNALAGSGVLGWTESNSGAPWAPYFGDAGYGLECTGPVAAETRTLGPTTYTEVPPGTYTLTMDTDVCGSSIRKRDTTTVVVGPGVTPLSRSLGFGELTLDSTTVEVGQPVHWSSTFFGGSEDESFDYVGVNGAVGKFLTLTGSPGPGCRTQDYTTPFAHDASYISFDQPGTYGILWRWSCDGPIAETGPPVKDVMGGMGPGYGGNLQDAEQLAKDDPVHNLVVLITVVPGPSGSASPSPSASGSATATPTSTATTPAKPTETPTATPSS